MTEGNEAHVHHLLIFLCDSLNDTHVGSSGECGEGVADEVHECRDDTLIAVWAVGGEVSHHRILHNTEIEIVIIGDSAKACSDTCSLWILNTGVPVSRQCSLAIRRRRSSTIFAHGVALRQPQLGFRCVFLLTWLTVSLCSRPSLLFM